jgi:hypothetical protein
MARFTPEILAAIKSVKKPYSKFTVDFVEFPDYLAARTYENEVMAMSDGQQVSVLEYLHQLRAIVESFGIAFHFDGAKGDPPRSVG